MLIKSCEPNLFPGGCVIWLQDGGIYSSPKSNRVGVLLCLNIALFAGNLPALRKIEIHPVLHQQFRPKPMREGFFTLPDSRPDSGLHCQ